MMKFFTSAVMVLTMLVPALARAQEVRGQLGASINNAGLQNTLDITWNWRLTDSQHPLLKDARITTGVTHAVTPAQMRLGGWVEVAPLSVLSVRAGAEPSAYFGTFNSLQSFDGYDDPFDKDARDARGGAKAGAGLRTYVSPSLRMKAGPIVGLVTADVEWWSSNAAGPLFYEPTRDTLLNVSGDRLLSTTSVVMYQRSLRSGGLSVGAIHNRLTVRNAPANEVQKIGAIAIREYAGRRFWLPRPRLTMIVAKYLDDPSKKGEWTALAAIGFTK